MDLFHSAPPALLIGAGESSPIPEAGFGHLPQTSSGRALEAPEDGRVKRTLAALPLPPLPELI